MTPQEIVEIVAREYGCTPEQIYSHDRNRTYTDARHMAVYMVMQHHSMTTVEMAKLFKRTHATVVYAIHQVRNLLSYHRPSKAHYINITRQLNQWHQ